MSALTTLQSDLEKFFEAAKEKVVQFADDFIPQIENDLEIALEDLASIAGNAVLKAAALAISGQEKFGQAVTDVVQTVEGSGKTIAISTAQMAVQQAYLTAQNIAKANVPPSTS